MPSSTAVPSHSILIGRQFEAWPAPTGRAFANDSATPFEDTKARGKPIVFLYGARPFTAGLCLGVEQALADMKGGTTPHPSPSLSTAAWARAQRTGKPSRCGPACLAVPRTSNGSSTPCVCSALWRRREECSSATSSVGAASSQAAFGG